MNKNVPLIETERLTLRGIEERDTDIIVKWRSDPAVYRYLGSPHPLTVQEHERWFREIYSFDSNRWDWIAEGKADKAPIGLFGIKRESREAKECEVSYLLAPEAQHKGYAGEALDGLLEWAKTNCGAREATAKIHVDNAASLRFIEKLEFQRNMSDFVLYRKTL